MFRKSACARWMMRLRRWFEPSGFQYRRRRRKETQSSPLQSANLNKIKTESESRYLVSDKTKKGGHCWPPLISISQGYCVEMK